MRNGNGNVALDELYDRSIKPLPLSERLQLAARILDDIPPQALIDYQTVWSEQDERDVTASSLLRAAARVDEDNDA